MTPLTTEDGTRHRSPGRGPAETPSTCLKAPVATLVQSRNSHDLTLYKDLSQAYGLLYAHVKSISTALLTDTSFECLALEYIKPYSSTLAFCIRRDMEYVLVDPTAENMNARQDNSGGTMHTPAVSEDMFQNLKDMADTSQHALQFVSCIISVPSLASMFDGTWSFTHFEIGLLIVLKTMISSPY